MPGQLTLDAVGFESKSYKITPEGFLVTTRPVVRAGIYEYGVNELAVQKGFPEHLKNADTGKPLKVLKSKESLSDATYLDSLKHKTVALLHPKENNYHVMVNSENVRKFEIGHVGSNVYFDGEYVMAELVIKDRHAIEQIKNGIKQLSVGSYCDYQWEPPGSEIVAKQVNHVVNHVALVRHGRAGDKVSVMDHKHEGIAMEEIEINGVTLKVEAGQSANIHKVMGYVDSLPRELAEVKAEKERLEGALAAKEKEIEKAKSTYTDEAFDAAIQERLDVIEKAKKLAPTLDAKGKSIDDIKVEALKAIDDKLELKDKPSAYIDGMFEATCATSPKKSAVVDALKGTATDEAHKTSYQKQCEYTRSAFKLN